VHALRTFYTSMSKNKAMNVLPTV